MSKKLFYSEFEDAIEYIKTLGREVYKKAYKEGKVNPTIYFKSLSHNRSAASGFIDWQENLKSIIS